MNSYISIILGVAKISAQQSRKAPSIVPKLLQQVSWSPTKKWVVNSRCPETSRKRRISILTKAKAESYRDAHIAEVSGESNSNPNTDPSAAEMVEHRIETEHDTSSNQIK